jgi:ABC-type nitrate/sulfonate/bicarbonate transport system substrate-binding protein
MDRLRANAFGSSVPHQVAQAQGFYEAESLEVDWATTQSSKEQMGALKEGRWDLVFTNADNVFWWDEDNGADFVIVLSLPSKPNQNFLVRPEISGYEDLRGRVLAVDAAESGYVTPLRVLLKEAGLVEEGKDFILDEVGNTSFRIEALRKGTAYGAMISAGQERGLESDGIKVLDSINRLYTRYAGSTVVQRDWAVQNPELLLRFLRAYLRAMMWADNPAHAKELATISGGRRGEDAGKGTIPPFEWQGLQAMLETRRDVGLLRGDPDPHRFADDRYFIEALRGL